MANKLGMGVSCWAFRVWGLEFWDGGGTEDRSDAEHTGRECTAPGGTPRVVFRVSGFGFSISQKKGFGWGREGRGQGRDPAC